VDENLAIIILNYNNYHDTIKCVDNLIDINTDGLIIIVDNSSTNDSFDILSNKYNGYSNIHVILSEKNGGYSYGNNVGIRYARKQVPTLRFIAIMNPDVIIKSNHTFVDNIKIIEENNDIVGITSVIIQNGQEDLDTSGWRLPTFSQILFSDCMILGKLSARLRKNNTKSDETHYIRYVEALHGSFFIIRADIFKQINDFDESVFMYYEENILGKKVKELGLKLAVNKADSYFHNHEFSNMSLSDAQRSASLRRDSQKIYLQKYMRIPRLLVLATQIVYNFYIYIELPLAKKIKRRMSNE